MVAVDAVTDTSQLGIGNVILCFDFFTKSSGYGNDAVGTIKTFGFHGTDSVRLPVEMIVPASAIFCGMQCQNDSPTVIILYLDDSLRTEPVMAVNYFKMRALEALGLLHEIDETVAHIVHFSHEVRVQVYRAAMIMDVVYTLIGRLSLSQTRKYMDLMPAPLQRGGHFGHMYSHSAYRDRV